MSPASPEPGARPERTRTLLLAALPLALFTLALNPWFAPEQHDDITYFFGARSIAESGTFQLDGVPITDWPPFFPLLLAGVQLLTGASVLAAKLLVLGFVVAGVLAIRALARAYQLDYPTTTAALTCLLPISIICGSNVLSEWPYLTLSFAFLLALHQLGTRRQIGWVLLAGTLLGIASLTRFAGVLLGAAIVAQAVQQWGAASGKSLTGRMRAITPEAATAVIGTVPWLLWKVRCQNIIASGAAPTGAYDQPGYYLDRFTNFDPAGLFSQMETALFSFGRATRPLSELIGAPAVAIFAIAIVCGAYLRFRQHGIRPGDWYVIASLLLLLGDLVKPERYFLPIAPFLIAYVLAAIRGAAQKLFAERRRSFALAGSVAAWCALLLVLDAYLLFFGNADGTRGGFSRLASQNIDDYYRKQHHELLHAVRHVDENAPPDAAIGADGFHGKYVLALSGRSFQTHPLDDLKSVDWLIQWEGNRSSVPLSSGWRRVVEIGAHNIYRRGPEP